MQGLGSLGEAQQPGYGMEHLESAIAHGLQQPLNGAINYILFLCIPTGDINLFDDKREICPIFQKKRPLKVVIIWMTSILWTRKLETREYQEKQCAT
jgi:hypothetical protein